MTDSNPTARDAARAAHTAAGIALRIPFASRASILGGPPSPAGDAAYAAACLAYDAAFADYRAAEAAAAAA